MRGVCGEFRFEVDKKVTCTYYLKTIVVRFGHDEVRKIKSNENLAFKVRKVGFLCYCRLSKGMFQAKIV